ncbi:MAG: hypothetical protein H0U52_06870 [Chloroflexi bacterium]|nr:hypothetical protein [Chloroflexota bacterium]
MDYESFAIDEFTDTTSRSDESPSPSIDEAPAMHVKISATGDVWHRLTIDRARSGRAVFDPFTQARTACGESITGYYATREETYAGDLCRDGCFTAYEFKLAEEHRATEIADRIVREAKEQADRDELDREHERKREEGRRRLDVTTGRHLRIKTETEED